MCTNNFNRHKCLSSSFNPTRLRVALVVCLALETSAAEAQNIPSLAGFANVCTGLSVTLPTLTPVASNLGATLSSTAGLTGLTGSNLLGTTIGTVVDQDITTLLSGKPIGVSVLDRNGNLVSSSDCGVSTGGVAVNNNKGIAFGGGQITGLGGTGQPLPNAGDISAIAIGNGSSTGTGVANAAAIGTSSSATTAGGVALGSGAVASRPGLNGGAEAFSGLSVSSTQGAVSVGDNGKERQITSVAGGTQATDAVNLRQLRSVGDNLSRTFGGGSSFSSTGAFTGPSYVLSSGTFTDVGSALGNLDVRVSGNTTSITNLDAAVTSLQNGIAGIVQQSGNQATITVGASSLGGTVSFAGSGGATRKLSAVSAGTSATDAVNLGQLNGAIASITINGTSGSTLPLAASNQSAALMPTASGRNALSIGYGAIADQDGSVALGNGAATSEASSTGGNQGLGISENAGAVAAGSGSVVSVGAVGAERQLQNVAAGAVTSTSTDAVNGSQLHSVITATNAVASNTAAALGGGSSYDAGTRVFTGPSYSFRNGATYRNVGDALGDLDTRTASNNASIAALQTGAAGPFVASTNGRAGPTAAGTDAAAGGFGASAAGARSVALGNAASAGVNDATAIGQGARATAQGAVALGQGSVAGEAYTVSVGAAGSERRIVNVAVGTVAMGSTDAVNGSQLYATNRSLATTNSRVAAALGGGAVIGADDQLTGPTYSVQGATYTSVGGAITAVDVNVTANQQALTKVQSQVTSNAQQVSSLQSGRTGPFRSDNTTELPDPDASGSNAVAGGFGSVASGTSSTAIGNSAVASHLGAVAIGSFARATADPTTAVGFAAEASGDEASAFGGFARASGANSTAVGRSAIASEDRSVAIGSFASAAQTNTVAIGTGVTTTRANQVAIGTSGQTYTLAGLTSAGSLAAQTGATGFVTTDAAGNLAASGFGPSSIAALDGRVGTLESAVVGLQMNAARLRRGINDAFAGIAIATALATPVLPEGKSIAVAGGIGTFHGATAIGFTGIARLSDNLFASGGVGFSTGGRSSMGGRGSLMYAW